MLLRALDYGYRYVCSLKLLLMEFVGVEVSMKEMTGLYFNQKNLIGGSGRQRVTTRKCSIQG